jgi:four helix bundle protein
LTDQIRRASRSVPTNIAEANRKRIHPKHFHRKLNDSEAENSETKVCLEFALKYNYINKDNHHALLNKNNEVDNRINYMILNPQKLDLSI